MGTPYAGTALLCAGLGGVLRIWPVYVLRNRFSGLVAIQVGHKLETRGIYGVIRNPSYLGLLASCGRVDTKTPPENFRQYMSYLKSHGYRAMALRDLERYIDVANPPADPMLRTRYPQRDPDKLVLPVELAATRADRNYWMENMAAHHYTAGEAASVLGEIAPLPPLAASIRVRPYPGGRPLRIGFREGAINPLRGTKASVFLPWAPKDYVVIDLPEAIFSNLGLLFLAHTHIPTIWNEQNKIIENVDWERLPGGGLRSRWKLPNDVSFGAVIAPQQEEVRMELWLENGTSQPLSGLRTQICVLLKEAKGFDAQTNDT